MRLFTLGHRCPRQPIAGPHPARNNDIKISLCLFQEAGQPLQALTRAASCNISSYMKYDSRLSGVLHVLLHMAEMDGPVTSEQLAKAMNTNPVVVRRVMAGLRARGYVRSEKGHGGGWMIACDLSKVTLRDIYDALGGPSLLAVGHRTASPECLVEQAVNAALDQAFRDAEALLLSRLGDVTLAALSADFHDRLVARGGTHTLEHKAS